MLSILVWAIVIGSSVWVLIDARSIGVRKGQIKGILNMGAVAWFVVSLLFWIIGFPLYLYKRPEYKRINGKDSSNAVPTLVGIALVAVLVLAVVVPLAIPPSLSTGDLAAQVQTSIEQTWAKQPTLQSVKIETFTLVHKTGSQYQGLLKVADNGQEEKLVVDVTYDGKQFMWQVEQ